MRDQRSDEPQRALELLRVACRADRDAQRTDDAAAVDSERRARSDADSAQARPVGDVMRVDSVRKLDPQVRAHRMRGDADPFERALGGAPVRHVPEVLDIIPVIERDIDRTELSIADKLFFLGTGWEILPILEIDGMKVGDGTMGRRTRMIDRAYHDAVRGIEFDHEWRTKVWADVSAFSPQRGEKVPRSGG